MGRPRAISTRADPQQTMLPCHQPDRLMDYNPPANGKQRGITNDASQQLESLPPFGVNNTKE